MRLLAHLLRGVRSGAMSLLWLALALPALAQAPTITTQPASRTVTAPATATFTVTATGSTPRSYQWMKDGVTIPGATSASYTTPATSSADTGARFTVTVTNSLGSATSDGLATLTVNGPPVITGQPASTTVAVGGTGTFYVTAKGTNLSYRWRKNGVDIAGTLAMFPIYTTPATTAADNGAQYSVRVTNAYGNVTSSAATLTVTTAPTITSNPSSQSVYTGQSASFSVGASGSAPFTYQWKKNGVAISGATASTYTTPSTVAGDNGATFSATVTNASGSATSANATLTVVTPAAPSFTGQPSSQSIVAGQPVTFSAQASGDPAPAYQWRRNGSPVSGATSSSYTFTTALADDGAVFSVVASNLAGSATSANATLTVTAAPTPPTITTQPASQTVTVGQAATFTAAASGTSPFTYQWKKNGADVSGATSSSYTTPATVAGDNGAQFTVVVGNAGGSVTSNAATLTVNAVQPPQIPAAEPANKTAVAGSTATFTVTATGTAPLAYQWYKGGTALSGATQASYTTPVLQLSDDGSTYYVVVTNAAGGANSRQAVLTVTQPVLGALTWKRDIVYLGTKEVAEISAAGVTVTLTDHLGSPRFVVEPSGNVVEQKFLPFGESLLAQADQARVAKGFTNHEQTDASGLIYMQARFYGPMYHRFLSPDPKYDEHFQNTQGWNIYVYCENSPVMRIDPDGMDWVDKVLGGAYNVLKCVPVTGSVMKITEAVTNQTASWGGETHSIGSGGSRLLHAGDGVGSLIVDVATLGQGGIAKNGIVAAAKEVGKSTGKRVAGKVAQEAEAKALGKLQKTFQTYTKTNAKTGEVYTGRTSGTGTPLENVASRDSSHHMNDKGFGPAVLDRSSSNPSAIRGREQILIDANGGARSQGGASGNAINGVSPSNPRRDEYLREGGKL